MYDTIKKPKKKRSRINTHKYQIYFTSEEWNKISFIQLETNMTIAQIISQGVEIQYEKISPELKAFREKNNKTVIPQ